jgi:hypothetical protein
MKTEEVSTSETSVTFYEAKKLKQSCYTPWRSLGREEV